MKHLLWLLLTLPPILVAAVLVQNRAPLFSEPGPWQRLGVYLGSNVAQTSPTHAHPELRTPWFASEPQTLRPLVLVAMQSLRWRAIREQDGVIHAEVVTPIMRFVDDVSVRFETRDGRTALHLRSASRVGRADFAANQLHLQRLLAALPASVR